MKLTEAAEGLKTLDFYIGEKDYQSMRLAMRRPPIVYLRASARKVIVNMDNEIEAKKVSHRMLEGNTAYSTRYVRAW